MTARFLLTAFLIAAMAAHWPVSADAKSPRAKQKKTAEAVKPPAPADKSRDEAGLSAVSEDEPDDKNAPLNITSQRMVSDKKTNKISFYGSVVAIKGRLKVEADEIHVFSDKTQEKLQEMEAIGSVKITHKDKTATGKKAVYYGDSQTLALTGDPTLTQGKNVATGEKVIYNFAREDMEIVSGANRPATITLFPKSEKAPAQDASQPSVKR